jgi:signal transduction histidine kinase
MLLTGIAIIWGLSVLSSKYFVSGIEIATRNSMFAFAHQQKSDKQLTFVTTPETEDTNSTRTVTYSLVKEWGKVPEIFQKNYTADELTLNKFYKHLEFNSPLTQPNTGAFIIKIIKADELHFVTMTFSQNNSAFHGIENISHVVVITLTALAVMTLFSLILLFVMRQITAPVSNLKNWAKHLNDIQLAKAIPDFHYSELNTLAQLIHNSLSSVQASLDNEKKFLGYASHELRTPISVSRSNSELLQKLIENNSPKEKQLTVLSRILRATLTMTDLTETLLWLNRREGKELIIREFSLGQLTKQLVTELNYLTDGKNITVDIETDNTLCKLPESICRIILTNLIRNAFQHTTKGHVAITQKGYKFSVVNSNNKDESESTELFEYDHLGFGLGLTLITKVIKQYQWQYNTSDKSAGKDVSVIFEKK